MIFTMLKASLGSTESKKDLIQTSDKKFTDVINHEEIMDDIKEYNKLRKLQKKLESQEQEIEKLNKLVFNFETIKEFKESENLQNDSVRTKHSRKNRSTNKNEK